jgi:hypothetical protein
MVNEDFVQKMRDVIAAQKRRADAEREGKLHDAKVIDEQGQKSWDALRSETRAYTNKIGSLSYVPTADREFTLHYDNSVLRVGFEEQRAIITYDGLTKGGAFRPVVQGEELAYYAMASPAGDGPGDKPPETTDAPVSIRDMAERLISILVE